MHILFLVLLSGLYTLCELKSLQYYREARNSNVVVFHVSFNFVQSLDYENISEHFLLYSMHVHVYICVLVLLLIVTWIVGGACIPPILYAVIVA